jgi:uncharacterized protein YjbI with pentapeptide repeats
MLGPNLRSPNLPGTNLLGPNLRDHNLLGMNMLGLNITPKVLRVFLIKIAPFESKVNYAQGGHLV